MGTRQLTSITSTLHPRTAGYPSMSLPGIKQQMVYIFTCKLLTMVISERDNALFEAGIKLGALYHQFTGAPVNISTVDSLEQAIQESISVQPYVEKILVTIDRDMVASRTGEKFRYCELEGRMLDVEARITFGGTTATVGLKYDQSLDYPLMRIIDIIDIIEK